MKKKEEKSNNNGVRSEETFTDYRDGRKYNIVKLSSQIWLVENLAYKPQIGNYWAYNDDQINISKYGYLYNWETAKNVCPKGWRLPTIYDFKILLDNLGGEGKGAYNSFISNQNSSFWVLFGGYRGNHGYFLDKDTCGYFWSSSESGTNAAWYLNINSNHMSVIRDIQDKRWGFSVWCIRD
jgi:uncharacterized protein (TIGR02145 family)